ncbi:serine hydrolase domain-containing protein [Phycicoccus sp. M110.8]|uniref:serine hydrolase domain-containing protein n=1 Tax=Phycicoccus sp. M110.8 TaxID=3075433 RepID=UPI0028FD8453|nr:serine hydrolase domain-containing protein [Phycicoccus sp. M110.8]MDU0314857.1 serine hydrolase domain-containing protein [Phycicoccus sp. M110.8]
MDSTLQDSTRRRLRAIALERQRTGRVPGVAAGVVRRGELLWTDGIGTVDVSAPRAPGPDDQFLVASNTKSFTAVLVMALRDEGRLDLDDRLDEHLPGVTQRATVRQALAHATGLAREPLGDIWETLEQPDLATLMADFNAIERVGRPHDRWHYSNVVYAVLGELVARLDGRPWEESLRARILEPLGMTRTTVGFDDGPRATGYHLSPFHDVPQVEPVVDLRAMAPCGALVSTVSDLARWSGFVADPDPSVLSPDTFEEMTQPQLMTDPDGWTGAMGLGFFLVRSPRGRTWVGHTGGMPGQVSGVFTHRESGTGGIVLMNSSSSPDPTAFALALGDHVVDHDPAEEPAWQPGTSVPAHLVPLLGRWFSEGSGYTFSVREGRLEARADAAPADRAPSVFERLDEDTYRTVSGRERGELLRVTRGPDGAVLKLNWATYLVSREPLAFGEQPSR